MKVFARFWNFPNIGADCRLTLIVTAGFLSQCGDLEMLGKQPGTCLLPAYTLSRLWNSVMTSHS